MRKQQRKPKGAKETHLSLHEIILYCEKALSLETSPVCFEAVSEHLASCAQCRGLLENIDLIHMTDNDIRDMTFGTVRSRMAYQRNWRHLYEVCCLECNKQLRKFEDSVSGSRENRKKGTKTAKEKAKVLKFERRSEKVDG